LASSIWTASWFAKLPADATPVGISRGVPRGRAGYRRLRELEPGEWFKSVPPEQYLALYREILEHLDPEAPVRFRLVTPGEAVQELGGIRINPTVGLLLDMPADKPGHEVLGESRRRRRT
jgi:hypothetical protein